ncbi:MAG TPA: glycine zipper 2TM domain-containing protein [Adhaeribacter sp.]|nr:glycine zipper 2TM domain-containing protein [Adhaeribacter sp.]
MKKSNYIFALVLVLAMSLSTALQAQTTEKKKMSPVTKGAIIGAGTGAAAGAVIHKKNRVAGGIVGAAVGGAVGAGVGKVVDNKQKQKAAEEQQRMEQLEQVAAANNPEPTYTPATRTYAPAKTKAVARTSYKNSASKVTAPAQEVMGVQPAYMEHGWILNDGENDPMVAYSTTEFKRKSW